MGVYPRRCELSGSCFGMLRESCFTVQCQGYGASHKSALIVAPRKLRLTVRNSTDWWIFDMFSKTSVPSTLFSLKPIHSNGGAGGRLGGGGGCWKDFDCLLKYLMPSKYLRRCSWAGNNTLSFQHSLLIKQNKINRASGKNPERDVALLVGLIEKGKKKKEKKLLLSFFLVTVLWVDMWIFTLFHLAFL